MPKLEKICMSRLFILISFIILTVLDTAKKLVGKTTRVSVSVDIRTLSIQVKFVLVAIISVK